MGKRERGRVFSGRNHPKQNVFFPPSVLPQAPRFQKMGARYAEPREIPRHVSRSPSRKLDRFLMRISIGYPDAASEREILTTLTKSDDLQPVLTADRGTNRARRGRASEDGPGARRLRARHPWPRRGAPPPSSSARARAPPRRSIAPRRRRRSSRAATTCAPITSRSSPFRCSPIGWQLRGEGSSDLDREESVMAAILEEVRSPAVKGSGVFGAKHPSGPAGRRLPTPSLLLRGASQARAKDRIVDRVDLSPPEHPLHPRRMVLPPRDHGDRHGRAQHRP